MQQHVATTISSRVQARRRGRPLQPGDLPTLSRLMDQLVHETETAGQSPQAGEVSRSAPCRRQLDRWASATDAPRDLAQAAARVSSPLDDTAPHPIPWRPCASNAGQRHPGIVVAGQGEPLADDLTLSGTFPGGVDIPWHSVGSARPAPVEVALWADRQRRQAPCAHGASPWPSCPEALPAQPQDDVIRETPSTHGDPVTVLSVDACACAGAAVAEWSHEGQAPHAQADRPVILAAAPTSVALMPVQACARGQARVSGVARVSAVAACGSVETRGSVGTRLSAVARVPVAAVECPVTWASARRAPVPPETFPASSQPRPIQAGPRAAAWAVSPLSLGAVSTDLSPSGSVPACTRRVRRAQGRVARARGDPPALSVFRAYGPDPSRGMTLSGYPPVGRMPVGCSPMGGVLLGWSVLASNRRRLPLQTRGRCSRLDASVRWRDGRLLACRAVPGRSQVVSRHASALGPPRGVRAGPAPAPVLESEAPGMASPFTTRRRRSDSP